MVVEAGPPDETYEDNVEYLVDTLPTFMANHRDSGNWRLYEPIGNWVDELEEDLEAVDRATAVQRADTMAQLERLGRLVRVTPNEGEAKEHYRSRVFAQYQLNTAEGTVRDLLNSVATILDVETEQIGYQDLDAMATVGVVLPGSRVEALNLSAEEIAEILNDLVPAGYDVAGQTRGSFLYVSQATYEARSDWSDYESGYDGLDSNDEPKESGGTYAGIIN